MYAREGLGALPIGYNVGTGPSDPCADPAYAALNPNCGGPSSPDPAGSVEYVTQTEYVKADPRTLEWNPLLNIAEAEPTSPLTLEAQAAPSSSSSPAPRSSSPGGWRNPYSATFAPAPAQASPQAEAELEDDDDGPGFGIVEYALGAFLAWTLARSTAFDVKVW